MVAVVEALGEVVVISDGGDDDTEDSRYSKSPQGRVDVDTSLAQEEEWEDMVAVILFILLIVVCHH